MCFWGMAVKGGAHTEQKAQILMQNNQRRQKLECLLRRKIKSCEMNQSLDFPQASEETQGRLFCLWTRCRASEQLWDGLQVKDESSPTGRHQSLMDWCIREGKKRQGEEGEPGREQTTNTPSLRPVLTLVRIRGVIDVPDPPSPSQHICNQSTKRENEGYDAIHDSKQTQCPETLVISCAEESLVLLKTLKTEGC